MFPTTSGSGRRGAEIMAPLHGQKYLNGTTLLYRSDEKQACFARIHLGKSTSAGQGLCGCPRVRVRVSEIDVELDRQARRRVQPHPHYFPAPNATDRRRARPGPARRRDSECRRRIDGRPTSPLRRTITLLPSSATPKSNPRAMEK
jgi:hypothetical protein